MRLYLSICIFMSIAIYAQKNNQLIQHIESNKAAYEKMALEIWSKPEPGYLETSTVAILAAALKNASFSVIEGIAEIPTAFVAEFGSGKPVIDELCL